MNGRANILARMRRWARRSGRSVLALAAVAYVGAAAAPCVAAASSAMPVVDVAREQAAGLHELSTVHGQHAVHESAASGVPSHHHHGETEAGPASPESGTRHCPHCPVRSDGGTGIAHDVGHSSCAALEDVAHGAAPQAKETLQTAASPMLGPAAFVWPPPLASPVTAPSASRSIPSASVPLNLRHCVYLI